MNLHSAKPPLEIALLVPDSCNDHISRLRELATFLGLEGFDRGMGVIVGADASTRVTFDYQFITNPAYNRDRGPVSVFGERHIRSSEEIASIWPTIAIDRSAPAHTQF